MSSVSSGLDVERLRSCEFPLSSACAYLNHAASSPLPRRSAEALRRYGETRLRPDLRYRSGGPGHDSGPLRRALADAINCDPSEIGFVPSTSDGVGIVANAIDWRPGENVVFPECEYPGVVYPWLNLARRGVEARMVPAPLGHVDHDTLAALIDDRTRAVMVSHVEWSSGFRVDVERLGELCRKRGILLVVDAIQSLGVTPVDVKAMRADVLVAGCYKMLMGIPGTAVLYVRRDAMPGLLPDRAGQESVKTPMLDRPELVWKDDAHRYQVGSESLAALYVLESSLGLLLEAGVSRTHAHILGLIDRLAAGLGARGFTVTSSLTPHARSTIMSFTSGGREKDAALHGYLLERDVVVSLRPYGVRVSPHLYNTREDVDRLLGALS